MIILCSTKNHSGIFSYLDENYKLLVNDGKYSVDLSVFKKSHLKEMKSLAVKLSEDFPNFIRVDLYLFHNEIYLSELTFDSHSGMPISPNIEYFNEGFKNWKRINN